MAQPTAYSKTTNFAQDEANNVGGRSTVRTSNLDSEFSNIETTLRGTLQNLARIQRDDGKLTDGLVELYNLSSATRLALQAVFNPRGAWVASTVYAVGDLVEQNASSYVCLTAHSSTVFATDYAAGKWQVLFSAGVVSVTDYASLRAYNGTEKSLQVTGYLVGVAPGGIVGTFTRDDGDTTSAENGGTIIVASNGVRWKRVYSGGVDVRWFGAVGDGTNHQLSEYFASLAAAQAIYPHATALTQSIDWAAFQAAHNSLSASNSTIGGTIVVPAKAGYYLSDTWKITKGVSILGTNQVDQPGTSSAQLTFPQDVEGIRLYSVTDTPTGGAANHTIIRNLSLYANSKNTSVHGIHATCIVRLEHVVVRSFGGNGVYINGVTGVGATGLSDCSMLLNVHCVNNGGDGIRLVGNDTNVCLLMNCSCSTNGGWGYYDNAAYCNTYIACHEQGNSAGSFLSNNATGLGGVYLGCYSEGGGVPSLNANAIVIGGVMRTSGTCGQGLNTGGGNLNFNVLSGQRHIFTRNGVEIGRIETNNQLLNLSGAKFVATGDASSFIDMTGAGLVSVSTSVATAHSCMNFRNPNGTVGSIVSNGSATAFNTSSCRSLKKNIRNAKVAYAIDLIPIRSYDWKADGSHVEWGGVAQEMHKAVGDLIPGLVTKGSGSGKKRVPWAVDWSKAVPALIKYAQETRSELRELQEQMAEMAQVAKDLKRELAAIRRQAKASVL